MSAGVRLGLVHRVGGGARTNLNTKPGVPFCMQVTLASLVSQHNTTSLPTGYSDEWELRTLRETLNVQRKCFILEKYGSYRHGAFKTYSLSLFKQFGQIKQKLKILNHLTVLINSEHFDNNG